MLLASPSLALTIGFLPSPWPCTVADSTAILRLESTLPSGILEMTLVHIKAGHEFPAQDGSSPKGAQEGRA